MSIINRIDTEIDELLLVAFVLLVTIYDIYKYVTKRGEWNGWWVKVLSDRDHIFDMVN